TLPLGPDKRWPTGQRETIRMTSDLTKRLKNVGLENNKILAVESRDERSRDCLSSLRTRIENDPDVNSYPNLTIYAVGSYARHEASAFSDMDVFFIHNDCKPNCTPTDPHIREMLLMTAVVKEMDKMRLPPPSNDGEFLKVISLSNILTHMGGANDDHLNYFTARMLLLLESIPLSGESTYLNVLCKLRASEKSTLRDA
ncbi:hypothetical protein, partial [Acidiphilium angustum]|uniref:hypothetical protein n=1 Tax=Acidiphilium angustum TaxID=523 RepID=UPI001B7FFB47